MSIRFRALIGIFSFLYGGLFAADSLLPYTTPDDVPQNAINLWNDTDPRKDALDIEVIKEWREDGIVCRYVIFRIGFFKGAESRIAAFYTFPEGMKKGPAFVWSHGGGQRAERQRGAYFAKHGFATIDINWGGREITEGISKNTDWGKVDPSQGPRFYPNALRKQTKLNLTPDEHTIDPVPSPRNGNWFLLAYAGRRAITFLERQPEVDPNKIGFTGFSMGGTITSIVSTDARLKAVIPMVGGASRHLEDFPGIPGSSRIRSYKHPDLFHSTISPEAYWPHVKIPVLFLSATDDFHSTFDSIYHSMNLIPHDNWRVSQLIHQNHGLGPENWILINRWFDQHLAGKTITTPKTARPKLEFSADKNSARFTVAPDRADELKSLEIFYSHDPNPRSRFWKTAKANSAKGVWTAQLPIRDKLPLFAFANCTYPLPDAIDAFQGTATVFTVTSDEAVYLPDEIDADLLHATAKPVTVFHDFEKEGYTDWGFSARGGIATYKFRDPDRKNPNANQALRVTLNVPRERLSYRFRLAKNRYITGVREPQKDFSASRNFKEIGKQTLVLRPTDFIERDKTAMTNWGNITTLTFGIYDGVARANLHFTDPKNHGLIKKLEWVTE